MSADGVDGALPPPPWDALRRRIEAVAPNGGADGGPSSAELSRVLDDWWVEQQAWNTRLLDLLGVHHEINNALVGVRGNAQLLLMSPAGQQPGVRERLEVVLRESGRIQEAAGRIRELKTSLGGSVPPARAA